MNVRPGRLLALGALAATTFLAAGGATPATAQTAQKPNILFIMGDDIGWMQPSIYHRGLMVGRTPNIDRIGNEGALFTTYYAEQSCTAGRNCLLHRHAPAAHGHDPAATARQPVISAARHAGAGGSCTTSAIPPASSARTTWAITCRLCRPRTASRSSGATSTTSTPCRG